MSGTIKIKIDTLGRPSIEAEGFTGQNCAEATKNIEKVFSGGGAMTRELKPEWYQEEDAEQTEDVKQW